MGYAFPCDYWQMFGQRTWIIHQASIVQYLESLRGKGMNCIDNTRNVSMAGKICSVQGHMHVYTYILKLTICESMLILTKQWEHYIFMWL